MKEVNLNIHREFLDSGKAIVTAVRDSYIEGYFLKGEKLKVTEIIGSMLRVENNKGYTCLTKIKNVMLPDNHVESVHCTSCGSLRKNHHKHGCKTLLVEVQ